MSIKIIEDVFEYSKTKGNARLVLIALADNASDEGYCFPSIETIAKKANVSVNTAKIYIRAFDEIGLVKREARTRDGKQTSNAYYVNRKMIREGKDEISQEVIKSVTPPSLKNRSNPFSKPGLLANPASEPGLPDNPAARLASKPDAKVSLQTYEPSFEPPVLTKTEDDKGVSKKKREARRAVGETPKAPNMRQEVIKLYERNIGPVVPIISDEIDKALKDYPMLETWQDAISATVRNNGRSWQYLAAVLRGGAQGGPGAKAQSGPYQRKQPKTPGYVPSKPQALTSDEREARQAARRAEAEAMMAGAMTLDEMIAKGLAQ